MTVELKLSPDNLHYEPGLARSGIYKVLSVVLCLCGYTQYTGYVNITGMADIIIILCVPLPIQFTLAVNSNGNITPRPC